MNIEKQKVLRDKILKALDEQGFKINPHIRPSENNKETFKQIQEKARLEQISCHKKFLLRNLVLANEYCRNGKEIVPENIKLELREVRSNSFEESLFRWWNFIWWSIPYQRSYGRQMRFLLWDKAHNSPFGLICLQSPVLKMSVRDKALGIPKDELDMWVNRSMNAQRVGALPPYNDLLGGKMVASTLIANEIRKAYRKKYKNYISIIKGRKLKPDLLFITTTSAFGKSSLYNRLKYNGEIIAKCLGYTRGSGSFHIPEDLYLEMLELLTSHGIDATTRHFGHGPSRKLKLLSLCFKALNLPSFQYHGIKREFYLLSFVNNLNNVIQYKQRPNWNNYPFKQLTNYWKKRWALPRAERIPTWKDFTKEEFFKTTEKMLGKL